MKKLLKSGLQSEDSIQCDFFKWVLLQENIYPMLKTLYAIPNGGSRNIIEATKLKRTGTRSGVPDMFLPYSNGDYFGLFIEFKSAKGKLSESQENIIKLLSDYSYKTVICRSCLDAILAVKKYIGIF